MHCSKLCRPVTDKKKGLGIGKVKIYRAGCRGGDYSCAGNEGSIGVSCFVVLVDVEKGCFGAGRVVEGASGAGCAVVLGLVGPVAARKAWGSEWTGSCREIRVSCGRTRARAERRTKPVFRHMLFDIAADAWS
jgi:hypothetical protein